MAYLPRYSGRDATITAYLPRYHGRYALLPRVNFVLCVTVFTIQTSTVAWLIDGVVGIADPVTGAESVWRGVKALFVLFDEDILVGITAAVDDFRVWQISIVQKLLRLHETPVEDELMEGLASQDFDGVAQFASVDLQLLGHILGIDEVGVKKDTNNRTENVILS